MLCLQILYFDSARSGWYGLASAIDAHVVQGHSILQHHAAAAARTALQNQVSFSPFGPQEISVLFELTVGHLRYCLTDVPPQSNSPPDNVLGADRGGRERPGLGPEEATARRRTNPKTQGREPHTPGEKASSKTGTLARRSSPFRRLGLETGGTPTWGNSDSVSPSK